jgi:polyisoprenoid-binding protein YceI
MALITWTVDSANSEVQFKARHLMIAHVTGYFKRFDLEVKTEDEDFTKARSILFIAHIDSLTTHNPQRDTHLKSADFFAADQYPEAIFSGKRIEKNGEEWALYGDLTIRGITRPIVLQLEFGGVVTDEFGQRKAGFIVDGKIRRKDFNLNWDALTETGQVVVSNEIRIHAEIEMIHQTEKAESRETRVGQEIVA